MFVKLQEGVSFGRGSPKRSEIPSMNLLQMTPFIFVYFMSYMFIFPISVHVISRVFFMKAP